MKIKLTKEEQEKLNIRLIEAIQANNISAVKKAVEEGACVNNSENNCIAPLLFAVYKNTAIMEYLLVNRANPNVQDSVGNTALHNVKLSESGLQKAHLLLEHNADMYIKNEKGQTPYVENVIYKNYDIRDLLLSHGYVPTEEDYRLIQNEKLHRSILANFPDGVKEAVEAGADVNKITKNGLDYLRYSIQGYISISITEYLLEHIHPANVNVQDTFGNTLLHESVWDKLPDKVSLLLNHKADMYIRNKYGYTPYMINIVKNCVKDSSDITDLFLANGYVPTQEDKQQMLNLKLFKAIENNNLKAVKEAVMSGADVNAKNIYGYAPIHKASLKSEGITRYLLKNKVDINAVDNDGKTRLHYAVSVGNVNKIQLLLKHNADMYIKDKNGKTPFALNTTSNNIIISQLFISSGYKPSQEEVYEYLFDAIEANDLISVKQAVSLGANVNFNDINKTDDRNSVLYKSIDKNIRIMEFLLSKGANPNMRIRDNYASSLLHVLVSRKWTCEYIDKIKLLLEYNANMYVKNDKEETAFKNILLNKAFDAAELFILNGYVPCQEEIHTINTITEKKIKTQILNLLEHMQTYKSKLKEETEASEFVYADEVIEM